MKKHISAKIIIFAILVMILLVTHPDKGTFEEIVLNKYKTEKTNFDEIRIRKVYFNPEMVEIVKDNKDINKVNELLSLFNKLPLVENNGSIISKLYSIKDDNSKSKSEYIILLKSSKTYESMYIHVNNDNTISIYAKTKHKTKLKIEYKRKHNYYKILGDEKLINHLDDLFNSIVEDS